MPPMPPDVAGPARTLLPLSAWPDAGDAVGGRAGAERERAGDRGHRKQRCDAPPSRSASDASDRDRRRDRDRDAQPRREVRRARAGSPRPARRSRPASRRASATAGPGAPRPAPQRHDPAAAERRHRGRQRAHVVGVEDALLGREHERRGRRAQTPNSTKPARARSVRGARRVSHSPAARPTRRQRQQPGDLAADLLVEHAPQARPRRRSRRRPCRRRRPRRRSGRSRCSRGSGPRPCRPRCRRCTASSRATARPPRATRR